jgi:tRNA modification GTPase
MTTTSQTKIIIVINKSDLASQEWITDQDKVVRQLCDLPVVYVSATKSSGMDELKNLLTASVETDRMDAPQYIVTNARHYEALTNVAESLQRVLDGFRDGIPTVLVATDVRQAIYYLGLITGKITPEDILGQIFSKFCIGK